MNVIDGIDISSLLKSKEVFELFRQNMVTDRDKAGAIQAFEFCYELCWKTMKRILKGRGVEVNSPRDVFREAAINRIINDPKIWFDFIEKRNLSTHTYNQLNVDAVLSIFDSFSDASTRLISNIVDRNYG